MTNYAPQNHWYSIIIDVVNPLNHFPFKHGYSPLETTIQDGNNVARHASISIPQGVVYASLALFAAATLACSSARAIGQEDRTSNASATATSQPSDLEVKIDQQPTAIPPTLTPYAPPTTPLPTTDYSQDKSYDSKATQALIQEIGRLGASATTEQIGEWTTTALELAYQSRLEYKKPDGNSKEVREMRRDAEWLIESVIWAIAHDGWNSEKMAAKSIACKEWIYGTLTTEKKEAMVKEKENNRHLYTDPRAIRWSDVKQESYRTIVACLGGPPHARQNN